MSFDFNKALRGLLPLNLSIPRERDEFFSRIISYMYFSDMDIMEQATMLVDSEQRNIIGMKGPVGQEGALILLTHISPILTPSFFERDSSFCIKPFSLIRRLDILAKIFALSLFPKSKIKKPLIVSMILGDFMSQESLEALLSYKGLKPKVCMIYMPTDSKILVSSSGYEYFRICVTSLKPEKNYKLKQPIFMESTFAPHIENLLILEDILKKTQIFEFDAFYAPYDGLQSIKFIIEKTMARQIQICKLKFRQTKGNMNIFQFRKSNNYLLPLINLLSGIDTICKKIPRNKLRLHIQKISTVGDELVFLGGVSYSETSYPDDFIRKMSLLTGGQEKLSPPFRIDLERIRNYPPFTAPTETFFYRLFKKIIISVIGNAAKEKLIFPVDASLCKHYGVLPLFYGMGKLENGFEHPSSMDLAEDKIKQLISVYERVIEKYCC